MNKLLLVAGLCASMNLFAEDVVLGPSGGMGGGDFVDKVPAHYKLVGARLCGGSIVDSIQSIYSADGQTIYGTKHGGNGGGCETLMTHGSEYILEISGCRSSSTVTQLQITTSNGNYIKKGLGTCSQASQNFMNVLYGNDSVDETGSRRIRGFSGRSGSYLDAIGVVMGHTQPTPSLWGSDGFIGGTSGGLGGAAFIVIPDSLKIDKLRICSGTKVDSIRINDGDKYGGNGGGCNDIHLRANEYIRELYGHYDSKGSNGLTSLNILTTSGRLFQAGDQGRGINYRYVGNDSDQIIGGLTGRSGDRIDAIGVYYQ